MPWVVSPPCDRNDAAAGVDPKELFDDSELCRAVTKALNAWFKASRGIDEFDSLKPEIAASTWDIKP